MRGNGRRFEGSLNSTSHSLPGPERRSVYAVFGVTAMLGSERRAVSDVLCIAQIGCFTVGQLWPNFDPKFDPNLFSNLHEVGGKVDQVYCEKLAGIPSQMALKIAESSSPPNETI